VTTTILNDKSMVNTQTKKRFDIGKISKILSYRRFLIMGISCGVISVTSLIAVITKPMYQSSMQVMISDDLEPELRSNQTSNKTDSYGHQMRFLLSGKILQKAVDLLHKDYPDIQLKDIRDKVDFGTDGRLEIRLADNISSTSKVNNPIFVISFKDSNPVKTQRVLQALEKAYQDYNLEVKNQRLSQGMNFVNSQLPKLQTNALAAEKKLAIFQKKHSLIDPQIQTKVFFQSLTDIQKQRENYRSQIKDLDARIKDIERKLLSFQNQQSFASLNDGKNYQNLVAEIRKTEANLAQQLSRYTESYPVVIRLKEKHKMQLEVLKKELQLSQVNNSTKDKLNPEYIAGIEKRLSEDLSQFKKQQIQLVEQDNKLAKSELEIRELLSKFPGIITEYNQLLSATKIQRQNLGQMLQFQQSLGMKIAQSSFQLEVLETPNIGIYIGNRKWLLILGGIVTGPILGIIVVLVREMFNRAIISPLDLQNIANIPLLGSLPQLGTSIFKNSWKSRIKTRLKEIIQRKQETAAIAENTRDVISLSGNRNLDMIYHNLQVSHNSLPFKSLMLTSALPGEGKTTLAIGLGASAANMHQKVLVIDGNLRSSQLHKVLSIHNDWGLSLLLLDDIKTQFPNYVQPIHPLIDVLTAGPQPDNAVSLLTSGKFQELLEVLDGIYDLVIIDACSLLDGVEARIMASVSNSIVMVGKIGQLTPDQLIQAREILSDFNLIGIVSNQFHHSDTNFNF